MDREISFLRDILLHPRMDFDEQKNESLVTIVLDIFLFFFFLLFKIQAILRISR